MGWTEPHEPRSVPDIAGRDSMSFEEWMKYGLKRGWIAEGVCQTHDMVPMTPEESDEFEAGHDPCVPVLRVWMKKV